MSKLCLTWTSTHRFLDSLYLLFHHHCPRRVPTRKPISSNRVKTSGLPNPPLTPLNPVPQVLVVLIYMLLLYVIFHQCSVNIAHLQAQQRGILEDGLQGMYCAVHSKYIMFK